LESTEDTKQKNGGGNGGGGQLNLNTVLLAICISLSGWLLYSVNQLDEKIAGIEPAMNYNTNAIEEIKGVNNSRDERLYEMSTRLTRLEGLEDNRNKNRN
jgi:hypothetical protein